MRNLDPVTVGNSLAVQHNATIGTPLDLLSLMQIKDPATTSQEKATIFDLAKKTRFNGRVQRYRSLVAPVKVPQGSPCLTFIVPEKKPAWKFTKEGEVLKSTPAKSSHRSHTISVEPE